MKTMHTSAHQTILVIPEDKLKQCTYPKNSRKKKKKNKIVRRKKYLIVLIVIGILTITAGGIIIYIIMNNNNSGDHHPNSDPKPKPNLDSDDPNPNSDPKPVPSQEDLEFIKKFPGLLSQNGADSCFVIDAVNILWNTNLREQVPQWQIDENMNPWARKNSAAFAFKELFTTDDSNTRFENILQLRTTVRDYFGNRAHEYGYCDTIKFMEDLLYTMKHELYTMKHEKGLSHPIIDVTNYMLTKKEINDADLVLHILSSEEFPQLVIFDTMPDAQRNFKTSEQFIVGGLTYKLASISGGTPSHYVPFLRDYQGDGWWISLSFGERKVYKTLADVRKTSDGGPSQGDRGAHAYIYVRTN